MEPERQRERERENKKKDGIRYWKENTLYGMKRNNF